MRRGFSLVELSIVLVVLGLLVGAVLSGQSLIRAAELRSLTTDYSKFSAATHTFRDKYFALPGDMTNATQFWGVAAGDGIAVNAPCRNTATTDGRTCNGDGDGLVSCTLPGCTFYEMNRFWQHLSNAALIEGNYVGAPSPSYFEIERNVPRARIASNASWLALHYSAIAGTTTSFADLGGNRFGISGATYILKPEEAWNIDVKLDDGRPNTGFMISSKGNASFPCSTTFGQPIAADVNAQYNLSSQIVSCLSVFNF